LTAQHQFPTLSSQAHSFLKHTPIFLTYMLVITCSGTEVLLLECLYHLHQVLSLHSSLHESWSSVLNKCPLVTSSTANSTASSEMRFFNLSTVRLETQTEALLKMVITHELVPFIFKNKPIISVLSFLYRSSTYQYWVPRKTLWSFQIPLSFGFVIITIWIVVPVLFFFKFFVILKIICFGIVLAMFVRRR